MSTTSVNRKGLSKLPKHVYRDGAKWLMMPSKIVLDSLSLWPERQNNVTVVLHLLCMISYVLTFWGNFYYLTHEKLDLGSMMYTLSLIIVHVESVVRRVLCYIYRHKLTNILHNVYFEFWPSNMVGNKLHKELLQSSWYLFISWIGETFAAFLCGLQYILMPIFSYNLPLHTSYPFWHKSPYYGMLYIWQSFMSLELVFNILGVDLLFVSLLSNCVAQLKILRAYIRENFLKAAQREAVPGMNNMTEEMKMMLVCIQRHKRLIRVCEEIDEVFTFYILTQFLCSILTVCLSAFSATAVPDQLGTSSTYLMGHTSQLLIYCYMGNELIIQSTELSNTIFECGWHLTNYNKKLQMSMLLMMVRAQKPIRISAGGFGYLSLESFIKVLQFSFSVFTLLNSLMTKQKPKNG